MDIDDNNNSKKKKFLFLGSLIVAFMFGTMLIIPVFTRETPLLQRETGIQSNILTGEISENQTWENEYGRLTVYPKTSNNIVTQTQYANVLWKYPDNNIDIAFRFNDSLSGSDIWMWQNISHDVSIPDYDWITTNYTLWNITDFQLIDEPESVMFGDIPSDYYANGNCSMWMGDFYEPLGFIDIGFDEFNWLDDEHTVCELTYTYWGVVGYHTEQQNWMDWNSKKSSFHHTVYNGKHYYYVKDVPVKQDRVYNFKWQYDIPIHSSGKWDLLAKLSSDTIQEALSSGRYIMLDPWWSSSWTYYKTITVDKDYIDADLVNFPVLVNSTDTAMIAKCDGGDSIRFLAGHNSGGTENNTEFYYEIEEWTPGGFSIWVNVSLIHNDVDTQLLLYYNNSAASDNQNPSAVWDDNYVCVHHMNDTSAWNSKKGDSGTPQNNVAVNGSGISKIGKCLWFDGAGDEVKFGWFAYMDMDLMTVESWSKKLTANTCLLYTSPSPRD